MVEGKAAFITKGLSNYGADRSDDSSGRAKRQESAEAKVDRTRPSYSFLLFNETGGGGIFPETKWLPQMQRITCLSAVMDKYHFKGLSLSIKYISRYRSHKFLDF